MPSEARADSNPETADRLQRLSAGVFAGDLAALDSLAESLQINRSLLVRSILRDFVQRHEKGAVRLDLEAENQLAVSAVKPGRKPARKAKSKKAAKPAGKKSKKEKDKKDRRKKKRRS